MSRENFIRVYDDVFPKGFCEHIISEFERFVDLGIVYDRQSTEGVPSHIKNDVSLNGTVADWKDFVFENERGCHKESTKHMFWQGINDCLGSYLNEFSVLLDGPEMQTSAMKVQKTCSPGGYHVWHHEHGRREHSDRVLVYTLYLNTLKSESCGETEFIYQGEKVAPVQNRVCIFPAHFTHAHRGNPVYGDNPKYIITGWIENV